MIKPKILWWILLPWRRSNQLLILLNNHFKNWVRNLLIEFISHAIVISWIFSCQPTILKLILHLKLFFGRLRGWIKTIDMVIIPLMKEIDNSLSLAIIYCLSARSILSGFAFDWGPRFLGWDELLDVSNSITVCLRHLGIISCSI